MEPTNNNKASSTARHSTDSMGLGRTRGQRSAEIMAGLRAELEPTPENIAMTRLMGRIFARIMGRMQPNHPGANYVAVRPKVMQELIGRFGNVLGTGADSGTIVELASGFSTMGIQMAQTFSFSRVIEIDLTDVIEEKQLRLRKAKIEIPKNLSYSAADLGVETLDSVLTGVDVDVIVAAGLLPYFNRDDVINILAHARSSLKTGGIMLADVLCNKTLAEDRAQNSITFFRRQVGNFGSQIEDEAEAIALFEAAGYHDVQSFNPSAVATELGIDKPVIDYCLMVVGKK